MRDCSVTTIMPGKEKVIFFLPELWRKFCYWQVSQPGTSQPPSLVVSGCSHEDTISDLGIALGVTMVHNR
jgi:hypothetical protein